MKNCNLLEKCKRFCKRTLNWQTKNNIQKTKKQNTKEKPSEYCKNKIGDTKKRKNACN